MFLGRAVIYLSNVFFNRYINALELLKHQNEGSDSSSKLKFFRLLNKIISKEVDPEEVDLILPALDEELELEQLNNITNLYNLRERQLFIFWKPNIGITFNVILWDPFF
jgi:hypothetical protein